MFRRDSRINFQTNSLPCTHTYVRSYTNALCMHRTGALYVYVHITVEVQSHFMCTCVYAENMVWVAKIKMLVCVNIGVWVYSHLVFEHSVQR